MKRVLTWVAWILFGIMPLISTAALAESAGGVSLTTGLPTDHAYQAMAVQFDNSIDARPQINMVKADVIYEMKIDRNGQTRYTAIFNDAIPDTVEAVRSAYIMNVDVCLDWSAALVHFGGQTDAGSNVYDYLKTVGVTSIDGLSDTRNFYRDIVRSMPGNVVARLKKLTENYAAPNVAGVHTPLLFSAEQPTIKGGNVSVFRIPYDGTANANNAEIQYYPSYEYVPAQGVYRRYYNRNDFLDGTGSEAYTFSNVIVMYADYSWYDDAADKPIVALTGSNRCEYFIGGKHFSGTWTRASVNESTVYQDGDGNVVYFKPGKTFIQIINSGMEIEYVR